MKAEDDEREIPDRRADLAALVRLRDAVRAVILAGCGEPDLGELIKLTPYAAGSTR